MYELADCRKPTPDRVTSFIVVQEHIMVTLTDVALAARVERAADGSVASILDRVGNREEFVLGALPALQKLWLVFLFDNAPVPGGFHVAVEVRTYGGKVATFDSGSVESTSSSGQVPIEVPFLVTEVGPQTVSLSIDGHKVWEQVVFFALFA